ncbi:hypothetical protein [Nostoc sp.]
MPSARTAAMPMAVNYANVACGLSPLPKSSLPDAARMIWWLEI